MTITEVFGYFIRILLSDLSVPKTLQTHKVGNLYTLRIAQ